ncbi:MAG TPA: tyrosine--tRNA ligase [Polyangiaceae bacterium]|nr:tyrosine--tRNA ligase [Polyangiaceae bacterium]
MTAFASVEQQVAILTRGAVDLHVRSDLEERLEESRLRGKPLRVKAGFDPTRPDLHLGHGVLLQKIRQFQDLGHIAVFLIGDFTAMIGDPTGESESRPRLSRDQVERAATTYLEQALCVLDKQRLELRRNSEWLEPMKLSEAIELTAKATVARMLERSDFRRRFDEERPIHQHEFLYPLLQGFDSVILDCDVELGGTDQLFNLLMGRDLMVKYGKRPQIVMTTPLLEGTDARVENGVIVGKKMSKSSGNYVGLQEDPTSMFRKLMQIDDGVIFRFFDLLSRKGSAEIASLRHDMAAGRSPLEIKAIFASEVVERFHGAAAAALAAREFDRVYAKNSPPDEVPSIELAPEGGIAELAWALKQARLAPSTSEARRLVEQGGVEVDGERVTDPKLVLRSGSDHLVRVGSKNRRFARIRVRT